jgi:YidC/Oxa1 family membrane protein insertase
MGGLWQSLLDALLAALQFFHDFAGDWGLAIVLLTLVIRLAMIPLTVKQTRSMHEMQRIQPKIKQIQKKHKDDKQKQQEEMMKFYQDNKVNPFGGCLPLLLQMPVFIALFTVLRNAEELAGEHFWIILPDLSMSPSMVWADSGWLAALPYLLFVVAFGLSAWLPNRMLNKDPQQSKMGMYMAVMMLYFGWISPAGVLVYWVTSSVLQIVQQAVQLKFMAREEGAKA